MLLCLLASEVLVKSAATTREPMPKLECSRPIEILEVLFTAHLDRDCLDEQFVGLKGESGG